MLLVAFLVALAATRSLLCIPLLILSLFFFAVDVKSIDRRKPDAQPRLEETPVRFGVLGNHVIDSTSLFGLYIALLGEPVFIDIKKDESRDRREAFALFLFANQKELELGMAEFLRANPEFSARKITCIGLHSKDLDQGEVFWEPEGYTLSRGLKFIR